MLLQDDAVQTTIENWMTTITTIQLLSMNVVRLDAGNKFENTDVAAIVNIRGFRAYEMKLHFESARRPNSV